MATVQHANFIQYGRRMGKSKQTIEESEQISDDVAEHVPHGMRLPDGSDLRQVTVLPQREWNRIQNNLDSRAKELERVREAKRQQEELHAESLNVVKNWSNTIAGQRQKKLEARKVREAKEEEERVKIDIEEAKFQAKRRQVAIEKAKTLQYFQTDRVKSFHGALLLTEVLKERDAQVELKKQKIANEKGKDTELLKYYRLQYENGIRRDQEKARERYDMRRKVAEYQLSQAKEHYDAQHKCKEQDKKEGEELKKLAKLNEWEQQKLDEVRREEKRKIMESHKDHISNRDAIRALELQQDEEEDEEIRMFANAKKKMLKLRKQKEKELFTQQQNQRDRMVELLGHQLKQKVDDEDSRIAKAEKLKEEKLTKEIKAKEDKLKKDLASIAEHRLEQLALKEKQEKEEHNKNLELLEMKMEADRVFAEKQSEWRKSERERLQKLQNFHIAQINELAEKERFKRQEDLEHDHKIVDLLKIEEDQFQQYAGKVIKEASEQKCNTYPLVKAASAGAGGGRGPSFLGKGGVRPSYPVSDSTGVQLPKYQRETTESVKSQYEVKDPVRAKKRLGFVW
ncbi:cilia- and flagella- associated protein 210-like [Styela clava]|uniref:coiled-coil domain-containing protein 173-like n=1 Tax=Styela clava TaxID=7725 RepID=UPI001939C8EE|nr:coiled-coil domain-containing protein 173-like [Styela clava]XP_039254987.1 coiled-coil domain-containing protein 173-like [Styela clava]